jgi:hypothetical protein
MAKEETVLQGMIDKLIEIGRCYGMEMNILYTQIISSMGILPTETSVHLPYQHAACHCGMLSTVHHLQQVQFLWNPCCAVKTKQLFYTYLYMPPLSYDFAFLGFYTNQQSYISETHQWPYFVTECFRSLSFSDHTLLFMCNNKDVCSENCGQSFVKHDENIQGQ